MNKLMAKFKIIEEKYEGGNSIYRVKRKHPWFPIWMYIGKASDSMFFTTLNHYQTAYQTFEDAHRRVLEYRKYIKYSKSPVPKSVRLCKCFNF